MAVITRNGVMSRLIFCHIVAYRLFFASCKSHTFRSFTDIICVTGIGILIKRKSIQKKNEKRLNTCTYTHSTQCYSAYFIGRVYS